MIGYDVVDYHFKHSVFLNVSALISLCSYVKIIVNHNECLSSRWDFNV